MPGAERPADGPSLAGGRTRRCATWRPRRRSRARSRRRRRCAAGATASARAPGARVPARLDADRATSASPSTSARLARFEFSANGDEPVATVGVPGGTVLVLASDAVDLEAEKRRAARARRRAAQGDRARRGQARQPGLRRQGARGRRPGRARQARPAQAGAGGALMSDVGPRPRRGAPALARAVRHALRAGAHAPAADRARLAAGALPRRPRRRHQRQVLDRALHRGAAGGARRAHRRLPLAAPDDVRRADPDRRRRPRRRDAFGAAVQRAAAAAAEGRPHARPAASA